MPLMAALQLFFYAADSRGVPTNIVRSSAAFSLESDVKAIASWLETNKAKAEKQFRDVHFAGIYTDTGLRVLTTPELIGCVKGFKESAKSDLAQRYDHVPAFQHKGRLKSFKTIEAELDDQGISLWYDDAAGVPLGAEDQFKLYTFLYVGGEDGDVVCNVVHLNDEFDAALARYLTDEPHGAWAPLALMEGDVEPIILPEELTGELEEELERDHLEFRHTGGGTEPAQPSHPVEVAKPPPQLRKPAGHRLAEILTRAGVANLGLEDNPDFAEFFSAGRDSFEVFLEVVRQRRPLVVIETQYWEIADAVGSYLASEAGLDFVHAGTHHTSSPHERILGAAGRRDRMVFYDDAMFNADYEIDRNSVRTLIKDLVTSRDVGLVVVGNKRAIPLTFQNYTDFELSLPPIVGPVRKDIFEAILGPDVAQDSETDKWARYLLPFDFEKVLATGLAGTAAVAELKARVDRRLARKTAEGAPDLADIHGLGEAREVALQLVSDIRLAVAGELEWSEVDRGMLLSGPPGTGKTMLAKAISKESGIRFISGSALEWQSSGALDQHLASIREFFAEARRYAPTIVFIDEFDAIGNRQHHQGRNDYYTTAVVNCVLEELQGFHDREGVIVIGATNEPSKIDPALKRAGRLDQQVVINRPNVHELAKIYGYHIQPLYDKGQVESAIDCEELAKLSFGQTGADVEFYVRGARRRARKERRKAAQRDFVAEIMRRPIGPSGLERMSASEIHRTAVHEAGHALVQLLGPTKGKDISYVSIIPRPDGTLGFVATFNERVDIQRAEIMELLRVFLAGRAAEEVIFGSKAIGAGSGGGAHSDLGQATRLLTRMYLQYGYSSSSGLLWRDADMLEAKARELPREIKREVRIALDQIYGETVRRLGRNKRLLSKVANALVEHQEMTGTELRALVGGFRLGPLNLLTRWRQSAKFD